VTLTHDRQSIEQFVPLKRRGDILAQRDLVSRLGMEAEDLTLVDQTGQHFVVAGMGEQNRDQGRMGLLECLDGPDVVATLVQGLADHHAHRMLFEQTERLVQVLCPVQRHAFRQRLPDQHVALEITVEQQGRRTSRIEGGQRGSYPAFGLIEARLRDGGGFTHGRANLIRIPGFLQETEDLAFVDGPHHRSQIGIAGQQQPHGVGRDRPDLSQYLK